MQIKVDLFDASEASKIRSGWRIQKGVIGALILREVLTRYGRHNIGFLWLFVEPMLFTLGVTALWTLTGNNHGSSIPIVAFALTGYSSVLLWRNMPFRCISAIEPNLSLLYHRRVQVLDFYISRIILEFAGATISFAVLGTFFVAIGWLDPPEDLLQVSQGWLLSAWFGASLAMFLGAAAFSSEIVDRLWHPISYLLFPLSGAAFMVDYLPDLAQKYILYLPMVHGVELLREGYFGSKVHAKYDVMYMVACCAVLSLISLIWTHVNSRKIVQQ